MEFTDPLEQLTDINLQKYNASWKIAKRVLNELISKTNIGTKIYELCCLGDKMIIDETNSIYKNISHKGISYPTCVSVNNVIGNYIPYDTSEMIKDGDLVKIELGVHIDGFPVTITDTIIVGTIDEKKQKVLNAVKEASDEIKKILKPNKTNKDVVNLLEKYSKKHECNLLTIPDMKNREIIPGIISYQVSKDIIDGFNDDGYDNVHKMILVKNNNYDFTLRETEFVENEIYTIDVVMSTGLGKLTIDDNIKMYKHKTENYYNLKLNASKYALSILGKTRFPVKVNTEDTKFKLGIKECVNNNLVDYYPMCYLPVDEYVARMKFTAIIRKKPIIYS